MASLSWYYSINGKQNGPVTDDGIRQLHRDGVITDDVLLWQQGLENWVHYEDFATITAKNKTTDILDYARSRGYQVPERGGSVLGLDQMLAGETGEQGGGMQTCPICNSNLPLEEFVEVDGEKVCFRCRKTMEQEAQAAAKSTSARSGSSDGSKKKTVKLEKSVIQKMARKYRPAPRSGSSEEGLTVNLAGMGLRAAAKAIDWALPALISVGIAFAMAGMGVGLVICVPAAIILFLILNVVHTLVTTMFIDETLGKSMLKLKTVSQTGGNVSMLQKAWRAVIEQIGLLALGLGYFAALQEDARRTWHDRAARTLVIKLEG
jgi:uncharacterized RDD family membrane protein YckC